MEQNLTDQEMVKDVTRMGIQASILLKGVLLRKVDEKTLKWGLTELVSTRLTGKYFQELADRPDMVYLLNIIHLVYSLEGQLDFQIQEYGLDSLKDDLQEINASLHLIGEQFDLKEMVESGSDWS
jgi:hypothetical protein